MFKKKPRRKGWTEILRFLDLLSTKAKAKKKKKTKKPHKDKRSVNLPLKNKKCMDHKKHPKQNF